MSLKLDGKKLSLEIEERLNNYISINWSSGKMYVNGIDRGNPNWSNMESLTLENYAQVVLIANTPATDDMNLFSRYSNNESLDVTFYSAKVYDRVLTASEVLQNYNALKGRFGL